MIYAIAQISFLGNDDIDFEGYVLKEVSSIQSWEEHMRQAVEQEMENGGLTIYHSDNDGTPFETVQDVMDTISIDEIDKNTFDVLRHTLGHSYGLIASFMRES